MYSLHINSFEFSSFCSYIGLSIVIFIINQNPSALVILFYKCVYLWISSIISKECAHFCNENWYDSVAYTVKSLNKGHTWDQVFCPLNGGVFY